MPDRRGGRRRVARRAGTRWRARIGGAVGDGGNRVPRRSQWFREPRCRIRGQAPRGVGSLKSKTIETITLFVEDLERSKVFYQDVFGLSVVFEDKNSAVFRFENTQINLLKIPAANDLIKPGVVASPGAGSRFQSPSRWTTWMQPVPTWQPTAWSCSTAR